MPMHQIITRRTPAGLSAKSRADNEIKFVRNIRQQKNALFW